MSFFKGTGREPDNSFKAFMRITVAITAIVMLAVLVNRIYADSTAPKDPTPAVTVTP